MEKEEDDDDEEEVGWSLLVKIEGDPLNGRGGRGEAVIFIRDSVTELDNAAIEPINAGEPIKPIPNHSIPSPCARP